MFSVGWHSFPVCPQEQKKQKTSATIEPSRSNGDILVEVDLCAENNNNIDPSAPAETSLVSETAPLVAPKKKQKKKKSGSDGSAPPQVHGKSSKKKSRGENHSGDGATAASSSDMATQQEGSKMKSSGGDDGDGARASPVHVEGSINTALTSSTSSEDSEGSGRGKKKKRRNNVVWEENTGWRMECLERMELSNTEIEKKRELRHRDGSKKNCWKRFEEREKNGRCDGCKRKGCRWEDH